MRKLGILAALTTAGSLLAAVPAVAGAQTQPTPDVTAFCDAALKVDVSLDRVFSERKPSSKLKQEADKALEQAGAVAPTDIAQAVQSVVAAFRSAIASGQSPEQLFRDPVLEQGVNTIEEFRYTSCGYQQLDVTGIEYEFQGLPKTVPAGRVAIRFTDNGAELHELEVLRVKGKDSAKKLAGLSEKELGKKAEPVGGTFAMQGQTSYTIADMSKPGRYAVLCHLPVGSTSEQAAEQAAKKHAKTHAQEGMYATITVKKRSATESTATSAP